MLKTTTCVQDTIFCGGGLKCYLYLCVCTPAQISSSIISIKQSYTEPSVHYWCMSSHSAALGVWIFSSHTISFIEKQNHCRVDIDSTDNFLVVVTICNSDVIDHDVCVCPSSFSICLHNVINRLAVYSYLTFQYTHGNTDPSLWEVNHWLGMYIHSHQVAMF